MPDPVTPTASPTVSSTVGLKNFVIAPLTVDTEETLTYGPLQLVAGAIEASITPENADPDIQYADDIEFDTLYPDPEITFNTRLADLPLAIQEMVLGNKLDDNGVLVRSASDTPGYFAVGFKSEKANGKFRYVWLFKVRAKPITENYATKEGTTINRQTGEVEWTAIKRTHDGQFQAVADEDENGFTAAKAATFLQSVYTPVFTTTGG
jgi:phi13 family phage major tail protein